ncbi:sialidase [Helicobacter pylori]|nr:sialidase [Helicobacter pylori]
MEQHKKSLENLDLSGVQNISKDISGVALEELSLKNLDKNLQILKEVGVTEICKATKIASKNIHSILEKRYESLSRVHARGFIQILEREYKIDLSAWMKEFDKVCVFKEGVKEGVSEEKNQETDPEETAKKPLKVELDYSINQANTSLSKKSSKWKPFVLVLGVIVIVLAVVIIQNSSSLKEEKERESAIESGTKKSSFNDANLAEENKPEPTPKLEEKPKEQDKQEKEAIKEYPNTIYIIPKRDIWVEVIDLDEKKNSFQKVFKKSYSLETKNHRLLLRFGHGHLSLKNNHQEQNYNDSKTRRFLYEPAKGLTLINEAQYKELQQ